MIEAITVSSAFLCTVAVQDWCKLILPAKISSPTFLLAGSGSPLIILSSNKLSPSVRIASIGTASPFLMKITSLIAKSSTSTVS